MDNHAGFLLIDFVVGISICFFMISVLASYGFFLLNYLSDTQTFLESIQSLEKELMVFLNTRSEGAGGPLIETMRDQDMMFVVIR